ncbi:DUF3465 domain-containing protein [Vibrio hyugaensis]
MLKLDSHQTLLVAHNIDLAEYPLRVLGRVYEECFS